MKCLHFARSGGGGHPPPPNALMLIQTEAGRPFGLSDRAENSGSSEECKANIMGKHWNMYAVCLTFTNGGEPFIRFAHPRREKGT